MNEVEVPSVIGYTWKAASARLALQPLTPVAIFKPAEPGQPIGVVIGQIPPGGRLSSHDKVRLVFARALHGVVPRVLGLSLSDAKARLDRVKLVAFPSGSGTVVRRQQPRPGVAASPGMPVTLVLGQS